MKKEYEILIVDDEEIVIESIKKICLYKNYSIITATNSFDAIKILESTSVKLVVADIMMPEMNGFELLNEIIRKNITVPVILTSGNSTLEMISKAFLLGAIDFLPKPFNFDELESFISRGMAISRILKQKRENARESADLYYVSCPSNFKKFGRWNWLKYEEEFVKVGVSDFLLKSINKIEQLILKEVNYQLNIGECFLKIIDSDEMTHEIISPISGNIIEVNQKIIESSELLDKDPYFEGWIYKVTPSDLFYEEKFLISCSSD
ncbi:MAG: hypothetical protein Fur0015_14350 [Ignavibacteriales bacterium]